MRGHSFSQNVENSLFFFFFFFFFFFLDLKKKTRSLVSMRNIKQEPTGTLQLQIKGDCSLKGVNDNTPTGTDINNKGGQGARGF